MQIALRPAPPKRRRILTKRLPICGQEDRKSFLDASSFSLRAGSEEHLHPNHIRLPSQLLKNGGGIRKEQGSTG